MPRALTIGEVDHRCVAMGLALLQDVLSSQYAGEYARLSPVAAAIHNLSSDEQGLLLEVLTGGRETGAPRGLIERVGTP